MKLPCTVVGTDRTVQSQGWRVKMLNRCILSRDRKTAT